MFFKYFSLPFLRLSLEWWPDASAPEDQPAPQPQNQDIPIPEDATPEQRDRIQKFNEIKRELVTVEATKNVVGGQVASLETKLATLSPEELSDPQVQDMLARVQELHRKLTTNEERGRGLEVSQSNTLSPTELTRMKTLSNREFLNASPEERLRFVTKGNIDSKDLNETNNKVEFTFTYDGSFNQELYARTTAGQVLPENVSVVQAWEKEYHRAGIQGEFFSDTGKRLTIHEGTQVEITKFETPDDLEKIKNENTEKIKDYLGTSNEVPARMALEKGYDPKMIVPLLSERLANIPENQKRAEIESLFWEIAHLRDKYHTHDPNTPAIDADGKPSLRFAGYITNAFNPDKVNEVATLYGYDVDTLKGMNVLQVRGMPVNMANVKFDDMDQAEIDRVLKLEEFPPGSADAQKLFRIACKAAGIDESWARSEALHYILQRESGGKVGRLNYTIQWETPDSFAQKALASYRNGFPGARSSASWLGQMLLSNVDQFYPDGRRGLNDPFNEAVGMCRYITSRYGSPEVAKSVYGRTGPYIHAISGQQMTKDFREGY